MAKTVGDRLIQRLLDWGVDTVFSFPAIAAVDVALWDLKARLLDVSLLGLLGAVRDAVPVYGSGGFTSYSDATLRRQLASWAEQGFRFVKMKIGRDPSRDLERVRNARQAIGPHCQLFVDANGAYTRKQALALAEPFADLGVTWFEEPVSSDDLVGLHLRRITNRRSFTARRWCTDIATTRRSWAWKTRRRSSGKWGSISRCSIPAAAAWPARSGSNAATITMCRWPSANWYCSPRRARPRTTVANGFSCETQIAQATGRKALHLAEVLQMALREERGQPFVTAETNGRGVPSALALGVATGGLVAGGYLLARILHRKWR